MSITMRLLLVLSCSLFLVACGGGGGAPLRVGVGGDVTRQHRAPDPDPVADATPRAWLWEISGGGSLAPSYVLGTMHLGVTRRRALPPPLDEFLQQSRVVVMEIDPRELDRMFAGEGAAAPTSSAAPRRVSRREWLDRALPPATWQLLVDELGARVAPDVLRRMPPGLLSLYLSQVRMAEVEALEEGRTPVRGAASTARLDQSIFEWAVAMGRPVIPLETPEQALDALERVSHGSALDGLREVLERADDARAEQARLREAYLSLDDARTRALLDEEMDAETREILLLARNRAWMENLIPQIEEGRAFVAVGLAHLLGEQSVLSMLEARGFQVRRVGGRERPPQREHARR
ncbi:TraB/GumN family protein [Sandaracinus amylolyticus]|uniref:TraB/GumN family protein n=1 Tax=Sandaracinus amylolyticus TaxID=927083 RepID=A0A0F6VZE2_9BACT|nr:TraB/GumN family protein [Sandaracinus amylolyticus]AKF03525.1 hypothetical protein DB32_000674 [Sandaracinus amylolyticus]